MTKEEESHAGCDGKAGDVIADFTLEYGCFVISISSRGKRSVGIIGSLHRLESAMPKQRMR